MKNHNKRFKDKSGNPRYRLTEDEADIITKYRRIKQEAENSGINPDDIHSGWIKSKKLVYTLKILIINNKTTRNYLKNL